MTMQTSTLRPGLLVSLKTSCRGNVSYDKVELGNERDDDGKLKAKWETTRTIADPQEHEAARKARSKAQTAIRRVCTQSAFGLLCPHADADKLDEAIREARAITDEFNASAALTRLHVYVLVGQIAADDVEAVKAINSEVRGLIDAMTDGIEKADPKAIREAASKAKQIGGMLTPDAEVRVRMAIETAREAAKKIVKAGEAAAVEIDKSAIRKITEQRTAFLDLGDRDDVQSPQAEARAIDLAPETKPAPTRAASRSIEVE